LEGTKVTRKPRRLENPRREGDLFGETPLATYFKASQVREKGSARIPKAKGVGASSRDGAGRSRRGLESVDEIAPVLSCWGGFTRCERS
jgi:hypothetical protein